MTHAQRSRLARSRPRYKTGPMKGKFKPTGRNPKRKTTRRRRARKNPDYSITAKEATAFKRKVARERKAAAKRASAAPRPAAASSAAPKKPARKKAAKKTGGKKMAKKKKAKGKKHMTKKQKHSAAGRKGWRTRRAAGTAPKRKAAKRKATKKRRTRWGHSFTGRYTPSTKKRRRYTVRRKLAHVKSHGKSHPRYKYYVKHNDVKSMLMQGLGLFGGFYGMKIINNLLKIHVTSKIPGLPVSIAPVIPAVGGFVLALLAPKLIKGKPALVGAIQAGATIALLDTVVKAFVIPNLPASITPYLQGIDDVGYGRFGGFGYPSLGEYIPQQPGLGDYGIEAYEAMALDEYVQERSGMGYDVNEALADSEVQGFQSGYAAGSLAKTVFSV